MRRCGLGACIAIGACLALPLSAAAHPTQYGPAHTSLTASTSPALFTRGVYGKDASVSGYREMAATGFNTVMTGPYPELLGNVAAEGMKAVVWLGNFINTPRCAFEKDDNTVTGTMTGINNDQKNTVEGKVNGKEITFTRDNAQEYRGYLFVDDPTGKTNKLTVAACGCTSI